MPMELALQVDLRGEMPQARLDALRERLDLERSGRLSDWQDAYFGSRYLRHDEGHFILLDLLRFRDTQWFVSLTYQSEPPTADVVEELRSEILAAAAESGLSVDEVWVSPIYRRGS